MGSVDMDRLMKSILIRGEQLSNIEGAIETARLLQSTAALLNYLGDERSWGFLRDELSALRDYGDILLSCFGKRVQIACLLSEDMFIRRRVLLDALLEICTPDRILMNESSKNIDIKITAENGAQEGNLLKLHLCFEGEADSAQFTRLCPC